MFDAGYRLKIVRLDRFLTYRDVERLTRNVSERYADERYIVRISVLANIENHGMIPTIFRLQSLCEIYELDIQTVLTWYRVRPAASGRTLRSFTTATKPNRRGEADARLLREMSVAAHDFNHARRGRQRLVALKRFSIALRRFTHIMLSEFPVEQQKLAGEPVGKAKFRRSVRCIQEARLAIAAGSSGATAQISHELRMNRPESKAGRWQASDGVLKSRVLSGLVPYIGSAGANQIVASVSEKEDLGRKVESVLGAFLGKTAGTRLAARIINAAAVGE